MSSTTHISEDGSCITVANGAYMLTAQAVAEVDRSYLLVAWNASESDGFSDAALTCIPLDQAGALQKQYGDSTRSENPGKREGIQGAMTIRLIMADGSCRKALRKVQGLCAGQGNPVFRVGGREIRIGQATYRNAPTAFGNPPATVILADSIELDQAHYVSTEIALKSDP
jgi:hypothetical protein